jgi:hypothetical protein
MLLGGGMLAAAAFEAVQSPELYHLGLAVVIAAGLSFVAVQRPRTGVLLTFTFLTVMALTRRLLIPVAGWSSYDPLLLVAPLVSMVLLARIFLARGRPIATDAFSRLIVALLFVMLLEAVNPLGIGLLPGLTGLLFMGAPLFWFFIGRELADRRWLVVVASWVAIMAVAAALYGLQQSTGGLPPWDTAWVSAGGYTALQVYIAGGPSTIRAFGTFSSSSEYATYLAIGLVLLLALLSRRRILTVVLALLFIPILVLALFLDSSRGVLVLALLATIVVLTLRLRRPMLRLALIAFGLTAVFLAIRLGGPALEAEALRAGNALVVHQVDGLLHPLDPERSTLGIKLDNLLGGLRIGLENPLGLGTGVTTRADKFGASGLGTEIDLSNAFVSLGPLGGLLFLVVIRSGDVAPFAVMGVLVVTLGQWLNGGQYAVAPLIWLCIGWANHEWNRQLSIRRLASRTGLAREGDLTAKPQPELIGA